MNNGVRTTVSGTLFTVKEVADNDYILSANTYNPYNGEEEISHRDPKEILKEMAEVSKKLVKAEAEMRKKLI